MKSLILCLSLAILAILAMTGRLSADEGYQQARRLKEAGDILPLQTLLHTIQSQHPGRVLEVEFERKGERYVYEIEILDKQGAVWEFKIDASSGEIVERELED
ncbi:MAG: PepSY domain-containing protein [Candidatus Thiodiazotropha sp. (ex Epidulcina cf. delphinae)]|nr:PepSY domain-containing protein [Candidatus Thiodiazotropha sp. (ex Epidulcina cf. delphinae)]